MGCSSAGSTLPIRVCFFAHSPEQLRFLLQQSPRSINSADSFGASTLRFQTVAYLQQIWWFEVDGELEFQFPQGTYSVFFRLKLGRSLKRLGRRTCNSEHIHGWDLKPVHFQLTTSDSQHSVSQCYLDDPGNWIHYHVGDFVVENPNALTKIKFSMTQIDCTHTKGGLCLDAVFIYPSTMKKELRSSFL